MPVSDAQHVLQLSKIARETMTYSRTSIADNKLGLNPYRIHVLEVLTEFDKQYVTFSVSYLFTDSNIRPTGRSQ